MTSILLNTSFFEAHSVLLIWIGGSLLFLLLCYGIFRQWRTGKRLRQELIEIEKVRQNNIEYDFVLKAMKIAVWRYDSSTKAYVYENDYRDGRDNYIPGENESFVETLTAIAPADVERVSRAFEDLCEGRSDSYHQEYQVINKKTGNSYWEESYATIVERDADGKPTKIVGTSQRIDERKHLENSLVAARNKAEESDRLKTAFLANMGHEIRTPLNAICGFADLLPVIDNAEDRNQMIAEIQSNNRKLLRIIDGLVSMSKIEAGAKSLMMAKVDLNQLLQQMADTYQPTTNLPIHVQCPLPELKIESDREKVLEILDHLVQNAVKFTTEGEITLSYEVQGNQVRVNVADTGKGVAKADQARIFERFVKLDEYIPGTGLGLSVVESLVKNLGGSVGVDSSLGVGSNFWFVLPLE
jgi:nitrogen-specific signal transduction histidine kinase